MRNEFVRVTATEGVVDRRTWRRMMMYHSGSLVLLLVYKESSKVVIRGDIITIT